MEQTWCLLKGSDGARGDAGKQKVYEVRVTSVSGDRWRVTFSWGMAEKTSRQTKVYTFLTAGAAAQTAANQVAAKLAGGYRLAYTA